jgi:hypothetical protein
MVGLADHDCDVAGGIHMIERSRTSQGGRRPDRVESKIDDGTFQRVALVHLPPQTYECRHRQCRDGRERERHSPSLAPDAF